MDIFLKGQGAACEVLGKSTGAIRVEVELDSSSTSIVESGSYDGRRGYSRRIRKRLRPVRMASLTCNITRRTEEAVGPELAESASGTGVGPSGRMSSYLFGRRY